MTTPDQRTAAEERFRAVFAHLDAVTAYARRRGSTDPEALAAEVMAIAWRRLADVPPAEPRPWLFVTARNLVHAERRRHARAATPDAAPAPAGAETTGIDSGVLAALHALPEIDREALLLVALDDLTPAMAARALGISAVAFRVRLFRARRRLLALLDAPAPAPSHEMETA
jgi:RNA polymerase sigma-70 factor, ECF subfamily